MNTNHTFINYDWDVYPDKIAELGCTSANIEIYINGKNATLNIDRDSKTIKDRVYLSLYPFALWLARSWWRLIYETATPSKESTEYMFWRMAHDLSSAGEGFAWPDLEFLSDGKSMQIRNYKTAYSVTPINYINPFQTNIPLIDFYKMSRSLIETVTGRLDEFDIHNTELHESWNAVLQEYQDEKLKHERIWEARLGLDPGDADSQVIQTISDKARQVGSDSLSEIIAGLGITNNTDIAPALARVEQRLENGVVGAFQLSHLGKISFDSIKPWEIGYGMAEAVRGKCNLSDDRICNTELADLLGLSEESLFSTSESRDMSLASISNDNLMKFSFQRGTSAARRFSAARIIADKLQIQDNSTWLSATNSCTFRQKVQRSFAGELLCPINSLKDFIGNDRITVELLGEAAEYFHVNPLVPVLQLHNKHLLPQELCDILIYPEVDTLVRQVA
jgi:hypothetical protein